MKDKAPEEMSFGLSRRELVKGTAGLLFAGVALSALPMSVFAQPKKAGA
ncbi:hypothetical protein [Pseudomonas sp. TH10]|nr:hypothetical protein [Pseudomonas sp. TH10]MBK5517939.1 hypothetical protein [Pseudomonas sp. TH10]